MNACRDADGKILTEKSIFQEDGKNILKMY
jgi:hypothetical protein